MRVEPTELPHGWTPRTIGECCDILDSRRIPINEDERFFRKGPIPYYGANGQQGWIDDFLFDEELVLIAEDGGLFDEHSTRPIAYRIAGKSWVNNHAHILRAKTETTNAWIFYNLVHEDIRHYISGGTRAKLTQNELRQIEVPFPQKPEQSRIVGVLDTVDEAIAKTEAVIAKLRQVRAGLLHDLLTRGLDKNGQLRDPIAHPEQFQDSPLGLIPKEWDVVSLAKSVATTFDYRGRTPLKINMEWGGGKIPALSAMNVEMGRINFEKETKFGSLALYETWMTQGHTEQGDVLITMEAPLGNIAQIPDDDRYILSQRVVLLRPKPDMLTKDFLAIQMSGTRFQKELVKHSSGSTAVGIQRAKLELIELAVPKRTDEQDSIALNIHTADGQIVSIERELQKLRHLKSGLMADLLTGRVRVPEEKGQITK